MRVVPNRRMVTKSAQVFEMIRCFDDLDVIVQSLALLLDPVEMVFEPFFLGIGICVEHTRLVQGPLVVIRSGPLNSLGQNLLRKTFVERGLFYPK